MPNLGWSNNMLPLTASEPAIDPLTVVQQPCSTTIEPASGAALLR